MLAELKELIRLQEIDGKLMDLEADKGDLPELLAKLGADIGRRRGTISNSKAALEEIEKEKRAELTAAEDARERLKKSQSTLFSVKTTREYDAISAEIEQAKSQISESERRIVEIEARAGELKEALKAEEEVLGGLQSENDEKEGEMKERFEGNEDQVKNLLHERGKVVVKVKRPVYAHYERIRKIRDGVGVSFLTDNACSYCFNLIPPQRQAEIRRMDDMILCEVCGCILVVDSK